MTESEALRSALGTQQSDMSGESLLATAPPKALVKVLEKMLVNLEPPVADPVEAVLHRDVLPGWLLMRCF